MKFLKSEYDSIVAFFESKKLSPSKYAFIKKRGLLYLELEDQSTPFSFYRKTVSKLTKEVKLEEVTTYVIGPKKDNSVNTWNEVLTEIKLWLEKP